MWGVELVTDKNITARPSKIVAGLEPTKTNELLQAIGFALKKKLDSSEAVAQITQGKETNKVETSKTKTKTKDDKKPAKTKDSKEKGDKLKQSPSTNSITPRAKKSDTKLNINNGNNKKEEKSKIKESPRTRDKSKTATKKLETKTKVSPKEKNDKEKNNAEKIEAQKNDVQKSDVQKSDEIQSETPQELEEKLESPINIPEIVDKPEKIEILAPPEEKVIKESEIILEKPPEEIRIKTPKRSKSRREQPIIPVQLAEMPPEMVSKEPSKIEISRPKTSLRPPSVRPSSARPGAPRLKDRNDMILPQDEIIPMGKVSRFIYIHHFYTSYKC